MPSTLNLIIDGVIFYIEERGYNCLTEYLSDLKNKQKTQDLVREEILEERIAEILFDKLQDGKDVITHSDVPLIIQAIEIALSAER